MKFFGKRRNRPSSPAAPTPAAPTPTQHLPTVPASLLIDIALEAWRVGEHTRKLQAAANRDDPSIRFSIEKIQHILREIGIEIKDPTGDIYHEGMGLDVLTFDCGADAPPASRVIQETVSPGIYYNGKLVKMAKVIVGSARGEETHGQDHN